MGFLELFLIAVGLSMDAFAVAVCKGVALRQFKAQNALIVGLYFGIFQAGMPFVGYLLGVQFHDVIVSIDHWVAFVLLGVIGINMIKESRERDEDCGPDGSLKIKTMLGLAVATSIDALAVGITFAFLKVSIVPAVTFIGVTTFILAIAGVRLGCTAGAKYKDKAELLGGIILILIGTKILLEHLGVIG